MTREVAEAIRDYMLTQYVQLGAPYPISQRSTQVVADAHSFANLLMNGVDVGRTILGPSSTQLIYMLAECYARALSPGDEIIICETGHEANVGPWDKLRDRGFTVKLWKVDQATYQCSLNSLENLFTNRTKLVAFPHVSNLLGEVVDVPAITKLVHSAGAKVVVDGVAYAPHRAIDVKAWDVDWYVYSVYKVYGPHMGALYGKAEAFSELKGPNHFFISDSEPYKFELGGANHEGCAGLLALQSYLTFLAGTSGPCTRPVVEAAFSHMTELELPIQERLVNYLLQKPGVKIVGPAHAEASRISTISFLHDTKSSAEIVAEVVKHDIGIRHGHMYAYRMCQSLGIDLTDGVVRVSAVHYNTVAEMDKLIYALESVL